MERDQASRHDEDPVGKSLSEPVRDFLTDIADAGLDAAIELLTKKLNVVKQIPVIKWLVLGNDVRSIIQTTFFLRKYAYFIGSIEAEIKNRPEQMAKLDELFRSEKEYRRLIEYSLIAIDRYQTEQKASLLGVLFRKTFHDRVFSAAEYNAILFSIESMHPQTGIECLTNYYNGTKRMESTSDKEARQRAWQALANLDYSPLAGTGFLVLPRGGAYVGDLGGARISDIGRKFHEHVVMEATKRYRERLKEAIRRRFGIRYPSPRDDELDEIIKEMGAVRNPTYDDWRRVVYAVCGSDNLLLTEGQDFSDLNALLAQIQQELGHGRN